jgi:xanthine/uracil permease
LGSIPIISSLFQAIPAVAVFGATLLLFIMVAVAGIQLVLSGGFDVRSGVIVAVSVTGGYIVSEWVPQVAWVPQALQAVLGFPVSTGAFIAVLLELVWPSDGLNQ